MAERPWKFESSRPHQSGLSVVWQAVSHHHIVRNGPVAKCAMASDAFFSRDDDEIKVVRPKGKGLNSQFNSLSDEELSVLFETLEEWEYHLARIDSKSLRCDDEHFRP